MESEMEHAENKPHFTPYGTFVRVWLVLLVLTAALVVAGRLYHDSLSVPAMLTLTPLKAGLVFFYFMHLKYESTFLKTMVLVTLASLTLFIGFIFLDISNR
jgi:cytochrome c oxidase subunit IV